MDFMKWFFGGIIGAAIGGAVWIAVGYFLEAEVGYIAWGIGLLAGMGVRIAAGNNQGVMCGIAGVLSAVGEILLSKYLVIAIYVNAAMAETSGALDTSGDSDRMISGIAYDVVEEFQEEGKPLVWPAGMTIDEAYGQDDFPANVWAEAGKRWAEIPEDEKKAQAETHAALMRQFNETMADSIKAEAFKDSFNPFDLLWFGLAAFTAFKVGSGGSDD